MDSFDNPQLFENSSIVEKSSKTGIFSNKRLLVIKTGYLYYFSKVPKGYKSHVPNILSTFTDLPKSSIQIKNILDIRLQSAKSSNLIIKFYLKDMIDRQDIRKSIDSQFYSMPNKKPNTQTDQWKFMFTTVLQCRLWYNALMKLKQYFRNLQHKFSDFVANFDHKRNSVTVNSQPEGLKDARPQTDPKHVIGTLSNLQGNSPNNNNKNLQSGKNQQKRNTEPIKFDASKFITPLIQKKSSESSQNQKFAQKSQNSPIKYTPQLKQQQKPIYDPKFSKKISQQEEQSSQTGGYHIKISHKIQPQIPQNYKESLNMKKSESFMKGGLKESHLIEPIDEQDEYNMKQMQDQIREQFKEQMQKKVREQVQIKVKQRLQKEKQQEMKSYRHEVQVKEMKIRQLETQIHLKHLSNMQEQRRIQQEKRQLQVRIMQEQQKLNHARIDFQKQLKLQKLQNQLQGNQGKNITSQKQKNNRIQGEKIIENRNQRKWLEEEENSYEVGHYEDHEQDQENSHKLRTNNSIEVTNPTKTTNNNIHVNEFTVQTDEQDLNNHEHHESHEYHDDSFEPHFNFSKQLSLSKELNLSKQTKIRNSFFSDQGMTHRNILGNQMLRIQDGFTNENDSINDQHEFEKYNYFVEIAKLYEQGITSQQRINREVKLINYINYIKQKAITLTQQHIASNNPTSCQSFEKGIFSFQLACAPGKIMNIGGENKLIYSNKVHENLKRTFKTYHHLQTQIIKILKSKNTFPVRVPLCTLIQYKGYTILAKVEICTDDIDLINKEKYLKHLLPPVYYSMIQLSRTIRSSDNHSQFYMVKVLKPLKLTNEQKNSQILKSQIDIHSFIKAVDTARKTNISLCYEKLFKEYEQVKQAKQGETKSYSLKNDLQLLRLLKLMRELKKIFKYMEPFDREQNQSQGENKTNTKTKSQFVQFLLSNPSQLLSLIPSDTDLSTFDTRCGYFYSLLEFFIGIRVNQPVKSHKNTSNISYEILPVTRTFHFLSFSTHQHITRVQKHLSQNNIQTSINCLNLLKRISSSSSIEPLLLEIKILLKQKQYSQAEDKINLLREKLPLHDLRNIELNAFMIECYVFMGLETEVLRQIRSSLDYVEYMFGGKKNMFETNLHLLMAQTLLRMGNVNEAIKLYKSLLNHDKVEKGSILISFAQTLVSNHKVDPNETIPFLLQFIDEINDDEKKIELILLVAKLYARSKRMDKYVYNLQRALELCLGSKSYINLVNVYELVMEQTTTEDKRELIYKKVLNEVDPKFWVNEQNVKNLNTINLYQVIKSKDSQQNNQMAVLLSETMKETSPTYIKPSSTQVQGWQRLIQFSNIISGQSVQRILQNKGQLNLLCELFQSIKVESLISLLTQPNKN